MKLSSAWSLLSAVFLFGSVSVMQAQTAAPAVPAAEAEVPEGTIVGDPVSRADGRWLGLTMEGPKLQLNFYDKNKQPEKADRIRGVVKIDPPGRRAERDVMNPTSDGMALVCNKPIRAPWVFNVYITLIDEDGNADDTLVVNFNRSEATATTEQALNDAAAAAAAADSGVKPLPAPAAPRVPPAVY